MNPAPESYREYAPTKVLRPYVACYWTRVAPHSPLVHRVLPDGCIDIVFDLSLQRFSEGMIVGTMTRPLLFQPDGPIHMVAVRFRPGGAVPFLRFAAEEINDSQLELSSTWEDTLCLADRIREEIHIEQQIQQLESALLTRLENTPPLDCRVQEAVSIFQVQRQNVETVAAVVGVSRQHLSRLFRRHVGVGPKCFGRVVRMQRLLTLVKTVNEINWSMASLDAGYYDQAHMISECRSLTGMTPTELFQR
jgi:AraC-like DNA-binding protein